MQTRQVLWSKLGVVDHGVDLGAKRVEGPLEGRGDCTKRRQRGRQTRAQKTVVNAGEEQGDKPRWPHWFLRRNTRRLAHSFVLAGLGVAGWSPLCSAHTPFSFFVELAGPL